MAVGRMYFPNMPVFRGATASCESWKVSLEDASSRLADFLQNGRGKTLVLTGAGVSTDSGIRAYRGDEGTYTMNASYISRVHDQRYWARSYLGYPPVKVAKPNPTHYSLAALHMMGYWETLITQNVDGLHQMALPTESKNAEILELHGSLRHVHCTECGHDYSRDDIQDQLSKLNPDWAEYAVEIAKGGKAPKLNPDGDAEIHNRSYESFNLVDCSLCGGPLKPSVIFFGENILKSLKETSLNKIDVADQILIVGSALATFSAYRLVIQAHESKKPVALINIGPSRADSITPSLRLDMRSSDVLRATASKLVTHIERSEMPSSTNVDHRMIRTLLERGVTKGFTA